MPKKFLIFSVASALFVALLTGECLAQSGFYETYKSESGNFSVDYPFSWEVKDMHLTTFLSPVKAGDKSRSNISVLIENIAGQSAKPISLRDYTNATTKTLSASIRNFKVVESKNITVSDTEAIQLIYTGLDPKGGKMKFLQVIMMRDTAVYVISYASRLEDFSRHLDAVKSMINSFKIAE